MSRRALWLACGALSVGVVIISCTSSDGSAEPDEIGGSNAGGESSTAGGTNTKGGGMPSEAGAPSLGGSEAQGGDMGLGGDMTGGGDGNVAGMPGGGNVGEGGAGGAPIKGEPCESFKDCQDGEYCRKAECGGTQVGVCVMATRANAPVCGCDGITYYTGSLATGAGVDVRAAGVCGANVALPCQEDKCSEGLTCGRVQLRGGTCDTKVAGVCWQLPEACPKELQAYAVCEKDGCVTLCNAVLSGEQAVPAGLKCGTQLP